jgi:hypothetical protein
MCAAATQRLPEPLGVEVRTVDGAVVQYGIQQILRAADADLARRHLRSERVGRQLLSRKGLSISSPLGWTMYSTRYQLALKNSRDISLTHRDCFDRGMRVQVGASA